MFEHLAAYRVVLVSGPHRSGTTICARAIAHDAGMTFYPEEAFWHDNLPGWLALIDAADRGVIQCPSMCGYLDGAGRADDVATVMVWRHIDETLASQGRVGWSPNGSYKERYRAEVKLYGGESNNAVAMIINPLARLKYEHWGNVQQHVVAHPFNVQYESLEGHPLWVPKALRKGWEPRQTA